MCTSPDVLIIRFYLDHTLDGKYKALESDVVLVLYDDHNFVKVPLRRACSGFHSDMRGHAYQNEFIRYGHNGAGDVFVQGGVSGLIDWCIILFPSHE